MKKKPWEQSYLDRADPKKQNGRYTPYYARYGRDLETDLFNARAAERTRRQRKASSFAQMYGSSGMVNTNTPLGIPVDQVTYDDTYMRWHFEESLGYIIEEAKDMPDLQHHMFLLQQYGVDTKEKILDFCKNPVCNKWGNTWLDVRQHPTYKGHLNKRVSTFIKALEYR